MAAIGNKKAVLSQRWLRDARYVSRSNESLRRYGHSRILGAYGTPILGEGEVVGISDGTIRKSDGGFL